MGLLRRFGCVLGFVLLLGASPAMASPGWVTPTSTVSSTFGSPPTPLVASDARGDTVAVWQNAFGGPFFESERPAGGSFTTGSQLVLNSGGTDLNTTAPGFGSLFLDDAGNIYLFFLSGSGSGSTTQINVATKPIGGSTWTVSVIQAKGSVGGFIPNPPVYGAVAPNGSAVAIWVHEDTNDFLSSSFEYSVKPAGSGTWSSPALIPGTTGGGTFVRDAIDTSGDVAAIFGFVASPNLRGATMPAGGTWTTANQITTSPGGSSNVSNGSVAMSSSGQATAIWSMSDTSGSNPVIQFSTKALSAPSWPQAAAPGGANDLSPKGSAAGSPTLALAPSGATDVAYTLGSSVFDRTRPAVGGAFASATLPDSLGSPFGADVVSGGDGSTTVLWSGQGGGSTPTVAGAYRAPGAASFAAVPNAPGPSNSNVVAAADGPGDVAAVWQDQSTPGSFVLQASGLVTAPPTIASVSFPTTATPGTPFSYGATITPDQWTPAIGSWTFGDGTTGPLSGEKTYSATGTFSALLTAADKFGNTATRNVSITVSKPGGVVGGASGSGVKPAKPRLRSRINHRKHTVTFKFSGNGATGFQCSLVKLTKPKHGHKKPPKPRYSACRSPKTYKHLHKGRYEFFVRGVNSAGKGSPATFKFGM